MSRAGHAGPSRLPLRTIAADLFVDAFITATVGIGITAALLTGPTRAPVAQYVTVTPHADTLTLSPLTDPAG